MRGVPHFNESAFFVLFVLYGLDLVATAAAVVSDPLSYEVNPIARGLLQNGGVLALAAFKIALMVVLAGLAVLYVKDTKHTCGRGGLRLISAGLVLGVALYTVTVCNNIFLIL